MASINLDSLRRIIGIYEEARNAPPDAATMQAALVEFIDPGVVWEENIPAFPGLTPVYHGHQGVISWFGEVMEAWEDLRVEALELLEGEDHVVARFHLHGRGRAMGTEVDMRIYNVFDMRDGKIVRRRIFFDRAEALEAAGITETEPG